MKKWYLEEEIKKAEARMAAETGKMWTIPQACRATQEARKTVETVYSLTKKLLPNYTKKQAAIQSFQTVWSHFAARENKNVINAEEYLAVVAAGVIIKEY